MKQTTFGSTGFDKLGKATRRAQFLADMDPVVPWSTLCALCALIEPCYSKGTTGRPPVGVERMLRIYFLQNWFNLSDPAVEESLYDVISMREFVGIDLGREPAPDETTILRFRHLLEKHGLGKRLFEEVGQHLQAQGLKLSTGTIVDATIISAPSSTKNKTGERDPEMKQAKKGHQWYFRVKAHIGTDSKTKLIDSVSVTGANVHDSQQLPHLPHGNERRVYGDSAYSGQAQTLRARAPKARDFTNEKGARQLSTDTRAACQEPYQVQGTGQGRTRLWGDQARVRRCSANQPVPRAQVLVQTCTGKLRLMSETTSPRTTPATQYRSLFAF